MAATHRRSNAPARLALIGSLLAGGVLFAPAANAGEGSAVCTSRFPVSLTPGLTMEKSTFRYSSEGQAGTVVCVGSIDGHAITGPGTIWDEGIGHGSCNGGTVDGFHVYKIPTDAGVMTVQLPVHGIYQGVVGMRDAVKSYPGGFVFYPTTGDCLTAPATIADAVAYGIVIG